MITDITPLLVCSDCIMVVANDEGDTEHRARMVDYLEEHYNLEAFEALVPGGPSADEEDGDVVDFSTAFCEACGSSMAGMRHKATILHSDYFETCSWCEETVLNSTLYDTKNGARICEGCVNVGKRESDPNVCNGCDQDPWRKPVHYGDCALAEATVSHETGIVKVRNTGDFGVAEGWKAVCECGWEGQGWFNSIPEGPADRSEKAAFNDAEIHEQQNKEA